LKGVTILIEMFVNSLSFKTKGMSKKKPFILRVDEELLSALEKWAADEFRSTNGQVEYLLNQALLKAGRLKKKAQKKEE
jgi:hypothetical protein